MRTITIEFSNESDAELFAHFVEKCQKQDGTPGSMYCGLAASAIKRANVTDNSEQQLLEALQGLMIAEGQTLNEKALEQGFKAIEATAERRGESVRALKQIKL